MADARESVYRAIRKKLLDGIYSPKELSRQRLAAALRTSPGVVQWALVRLEAERVLEVRASSGTRVRRLAPDEFLRLFELRLLNEPYAAGRAARYISPAALRSLERTVRDMGKLTDELERCGLADVPSQIVERDIRLEYQFHSTIADSAQHPELSHFLGNLFIPILAHVDSYWSVISRQLLTDGCRRSLESHREVLESLQSKDPVRARDAMHRHLCGAMQGQEWTFLLDQMMELPQTPNGRE